MDKLQVSIREKIDYYLEDGYLDPEDLTDYTAAIKTLDKLTADLDKAVSNGENISQAGYLWGRATMDLWKVERDLLKSILTGIDQIVEVEKEKIIALNRNAQEIKDTYKSEKITDQKNMTTEEKKKAAGINRELKAGMLKNLKELNRPKNGSGKYKDISLESSRVKLLIRALSSRSASMFPLDPVISEFPLNPSPLDSVDFVDIAIQNFADRLEKSEMGG